MSRYDMETYEKIKAISYVLLRAIVQVEEEYGMSDDLSCTLALLIEMIEKA